MKYLCSLCGYVYDEDRSPDELGLPSGTTFDELDEDWRCPLCGATKDEFTQE